MPPIPPCRPLTPGERSGFEPKPRSRSLSSYQRLSGPICSLSRRAFQRWSGRTIVRRWFAVAFAVISAGMIERIRAGAFRQSVK